MYLEFLLLLWRKTENKIILLTLLAEPHGPASSIADLRTGPWFDPWLSQFSFSGLTIVIATGFIPPSHPCPLFQQRLCGKAGSGLEKILCRVLDKRIPGKHG